MHHTAKPSIEWDFAERTNAPMESGESPPGHEKLAQEKTVHTSLAKLNHLEKSLRTLQLRKQSLFIMKFPRVYAAAAPPHFHRMLQMQHLVKQNVLDRITRHPRMIKNAADNNRIVRRIVMPQTAARLFSAPGELRAPH